MKPWMKTITLILPLALSLCFAGCGNANAEKSALQSGTTQMEWINRTEQPEYKVPVTPLADLETPAELLYYRDGDVTAFTPEDEAFEQILTLNAARDNPNRSDEHQWGNLKLAISGWETSGRYLLYRYPEDSYGDILFCLVDSAESDSNANWMTEFTNEYDPVTAALQPADELIAFLDKASK